MAKQNCRAMNDQEINNEPNNFSFAICEGKKSPWSLNGQQGFSATQSKTGNRHNQSKYVL